MRNATKAIEINAHRRKLRHSPLGILDVLKGNNGVLGRAICSGHSPEGVDAFSLCLANTKEYHIHLHRHRSVRWVYLQTRDK